MNDNIVCQQIPHFHKGFRSNALYEPVWNWLQGRGPSDAGSDWGVLSVAGGCTDGTRAFHAGAEVDMGASESCGTELN